jgi:hypothetical protein
MLFCRSLPSQTLRFPKVSKLIPTVITPHSTTLSKSYFPQRLDKKNKTKEINQPTNVPLLPVTNTNGSSHCQRNNHYHYQ